MLSTTIYPLATKCYRDLCTYRTDDGESFTGADGVQVNGIAIAHAVTSGFAVCIEHDPAAAKGDAISAKVEALKQTIAEAATRVTATL